MLESRLRVSWATLNFVWCKVALYYADRLESGTAELANETWSINNDLYQWYKLTTALQYVWILSGITT